MDNKKKNIKIDRSELYFSTLTFHLSEERNTEWNSFFKVSLKNTQILGYEFDSDNCGTQINIFGIMYEMEKAVIIRTIENITGEILSAINKANKSYNLIIEHCSKITDEINKHILND